MTRLVASPNAACAAAAEAADHSSRGVALYHVGGPALGGLGHTLLEATRGLPRPPAVRAWDFLSIALAVFGADRFVSRRDTVDGWTRMIALEVDVAEPGPWQSETGRLAAALRFLTGDIWHVRVRAGGLQPPMFNATPCERDCTCLFSGGLDSLIGATDLIAAGRRPLLVSQASPKERRFQRYLAERLDLADHRFEARAIERAARPYEPSSRARSILFIAYGLLAASALPAAAEGTPVELFIPENGLIAINPPLTRRRIGSLSTRTTHPHFLGSLQAVLDSVGLTVRLVNPYRGKTKGEMLLDSADPRVLDLAAASYSCGKGKRINMHCGRCVPCLIRRAAFHRAGIADATVYAATNLAMHGDYDDVMAVRLAVENLSHRDVARWTAEAGPLPDDPNERLLRIEVVRRGLSELRDFLATVRWS
jgi:hypothetical protein